MDKKIFEKIAEAPARAVEKGAEISEKIGKEVLTRKPIKAAGEYWKTLGPGLTTGAADDDPSGIATYSQTGAQYGFQLLWTALFSFPLMAIVQEMCARIGLVTGRGLAANIRQHYPKWVLYASTALLFATNTFNLGADLGAMAKAAQLLSPRLSFALLVIAFALISLLLQIFTTYARYAKYLKYLALVLFSYVLSALTLDINWSAVTIHTLIPSIIPSKNQIFLIVGILGTTISPYLFFWQTSQEVEEEILRGKTTIEERGNVSNQEIKSMRIDIWSGMFISNLVMFFIIVACAATLFTHGITNINTAEEAALALKPLAGNFTFLLFTLGIVGTGLLAVPVLAGSASYAISESFGWKQGLYKKLKEAYAFYGVIIIAMVFGLIMNFVHLDPIKALIYSAVINGLISPIILILIVRLSSNKKIMGDKTNHPFISALGWITTGFMAIVGIATIVSFFL